MQSDNPESTLPENPEHVPLEMKTHFISHQPISIRPRVPDHSENLALLYFKELIMPICIGASFAAILFVWLPLYLHFYINGMNIENAYQAALGDFNERIKLMMHGDFSHYKDWAFPFAGACVGACVKLLYMHD